MELLNSLVSLVERFLYTVLTGNNFHRRQYKAGEHPGITEDNVTLGVINASMTVYGFRVKEKNLPI